ncbi:UNVERIFIED_CONTAM: hypothetical protein Sindi_0996500 [Sesamum indicum]
MTFSNFASHEGSDQCSRIFFCKIAQRRATRRIFRRKADVGDRYPVFEAMARHVLNEEEGFQLLTPVTAVDVKQAVFDIAEDKVLGPNGFSSSFYKAA